MRPSRSRRRVVPIGASETSPHSGSPPSAAASAAASGRVRLAKVISGTIWRRNAPSAGV